MEKILNIWENRKLTLIGRINIVKTLALSKLIFNSSNLSSPNYLSGAVNNMIFNFIWENKPPKIEKATIIGEKTFKQWKPRLKLPGSKLPLLLENSHRTLLPALWRSFFPAELQIS